MGTLWKFIFVFIFLLSTAQASIKVTNIKGTVSFKGKPLKVYSVIKDPGLIRTSGNSLVELTFIKSGAIVQLGAISTLSVELVLTHRAPKLNLVEGALRYLGGKENTYSPNISTRFASFGIRGKEMVVITNPLLEETEAIIFKGLFSIRSLKDKADKKDLVTGQWVGLGGRFGSRLTKPIDFADYVIQNFRQEFL